MQGLSGFVSRCWGRSWGHGRSTSLFLKIRGAPNSVEVQGCCCVVEAYSPGKKYGAGHLPAGGFAAIVHRPSLRSGVLDLKMNFYIRWTSHPVIVVE